MIRLLRWLWNGDGHRHKWKIINQSPFQLMDGNRVVERCEMYVLQCEHCGDIKRKKG